MSLTKDDLAQIESLFDRKFDEKFDQSFDRNFEKSFEHIIVPYVDVKILESENRMIRRMDARFDDFERRFTKRMNEQFLSLHQIIEDNMIKVGQYFHDTPTRDEFNNHEKRLKRLEAAA